MAKGKVSVMEPQGKLPWGLGAQEVLCTLFMFCWVLGWCLDPIPMIRRFPTRLSLQFRDIYFLVLALTSGHECYLLCLWVWRETGSGFLEGKVCPKAGGGYLILGRRRREHFVICTGVILTQQHPLPAQSSCSFPSPFQEDLERVVYTCDPNTRGLQWENYTFKGSLGYTMRPCLKIPPH